MKKTSKKLLQLVLFYPILTFFFSCEQEASHPQWDINILGPVLNASLGINELVADSVITTNDSGRVKLVFESDYNGLNTDSVYQLPDTVLTNSVPDSLITSCTLCAIPVNPGTVIPVGAVIKKPYITIGATGTALRRAVIQRGKLRFTFKNYLNGRIAFSYDLPKAIVNGTSIQFRDTIDPGTPSQPGTVTKEIDVAGANLDLTGPNGTQFSVLYYNLTATNIGTAPVSVYINQVDFDIETQLIGIEPAYVCGYLGQKLFELNDSIRLTDRPFFEHGSLQLDSATLAIDLQNNIGMDLSAVLRSLIGYNSVSGQSVSLIAPGILNQSLNLSRARETGNPAAPVSPTQLHYVLDNSNSNLPSVLQNLPDRFLTELSVNANPLGNISGYNDFIYKNRLLNIHSRLSIPMRFSMDHLVLTDTQELSIERLTNLEPVGPMTFTLVAENGFPIDFNLELIPLDASGQRVDTLLSPDYIPAAPILNGVVISPTITRIKIPIDTNRKEKILNATSMVIRATFNTDQPGMIDLYESYRLKLKLIADGVYSIR